MKKLEDYGEEAQDLALKLDGQGMSNSSIMDEINMKFSANLNLRQIEGFLGRRENDRNKILKENKNFQGKLVDSWIDGVSQLKEINSKTWKLYYDLSQNPEIINKIFICSNCKKQNMVAIKNYNNLIKLSGEILEQIKHSDNLLGKMQKKSLNITYNYCDMSNKIVKILPTILEKLEKQAIIKIISKKRFREKYPNQNKEFEKEDESDEENKELEDEIET